MDEVGRGPLAGSLVAVAAVLNKNCPVSVLKDSKKLSKIQRENIFLKLMEAKVEFCVEEIGVEEINQFGIGWANREAFIRLINRIDADKYIVDGNFKISGAESMVKADTKIPEVMAAAIIAKVTRDGQMRKLHDKHMVYGWDTNVGYGTKKHIEAIKKHGVTKHHRIKFVNTVLKIK